MVREVTKTTLSILVIGLAYSIFASILAYRETSQTSMLFFPSWIDAKSGVSSRVRWHGKLAFGVLFLGTVLFLR